MPIGKVKVHNVRGGAEVKGPSNAFAKLSALGGASTKQQALDEQQASLLNNAALNMWTFIMVTRCNFKTAVCMVTFACSRMSFTPACV